MLCVSICCLFLAITAVLDGIPVGCECVYLFVPNCVLKVYGECWMGCVFHAVIRPCLTLFMNFGGYHDGLTLLNLSGGCWMENVLCVSICLCL